MCIQVNRWFICPVVTPPRGQPLPPSEPPHDPRRPRYERDTPVPHDELNLLNLPRFDNFTYVRHQDQSWIRCAVAAAFSCLQRPPQVRTEFYSIPCPTCTRDDECILSRPPFRTECEERLLTSFRPGARIASVDAYFEELVAVIEAFVDVELDNLPLSERSFAALYTGMSCTQNASHIINDSIFRPYTDECDETDCYNISKPWSHNMSRAARIQDAKMLRSGRASNWFDQALNPYALQIEAWKNDKFGNMPNQRWFALTEEDYKVRYSRMVGQVAENVKKLLVIGPTVQSWSGPTPNYHEWKEILFQRENLVMLFIWYGAVDPGLSAPFLDFLMRHHILSMLNPFIDKENAPPQWRLLDCHDPATESVQMLVERFSNILRDPRKEEQVGRARNRRDGMRGLLDHNRNVDYRTKNTMQRVIEGSAVQYAFPSSDIIRGLPECTICGDKFIDQVEIPPHMRITLTPCCKQALHFCCFKGSVTYSKACPFCRGIIDHRPLHRSMGYSMSLENLPYPPGTGGLISTPSPEEIRRLDIGVNIPEGYLINENGLVEPLLFIEPENEPFDIPIPNFNEVVAIEPDPSLAYMSEIDFGSDDPPENPIDEDDQNMIEDNGNNTIEDNGNNTIEDNGNNTTEDNGNNTIEDNGDNTIEDTGNNTSEDNGNNTIEDNGNNTIEDNGNNTIENNGNNAIEDHNSNTFEDKGDSNIRNSNSNNDEGRGGSGIEYRDGTLVEGSDGSVIEDRDDSVMENIDDSRMEDIDDSLMEDIDDSFMDDTDDSFTEDSHGSDGEYIPTSSDEDDD